MDTQAVTIDVVDRAPDGRITKVKILNRTVEMDDLIQYAKKSCADCGNYFGTPYQGTYQQRGKDGLPFINLCGCTVRRYIRQNARAMASELKPDVSIPSPVPAVPAADAVSTLAPAHGGEAGGPSAHLQLRVSRLQAELTDALAVLQQAEEARAGQLKEVEEEVQIAEDIQTEWERRAGRASSEQFGLELQLENHLDRKRIVERGLIDIQADIAQAERNLANFRAGLPAQQQKLEEVRGLTVRARAALAEKEQQANPRVDRAVKEVEKLERRLAAARMRAGLPTA